MIGRSIWPDMLHGFPVMKFMVTMVLLFGVLGYMIPLAGIGFCCGAVIDDASYVLAAHEGLVSLSFGSCGDYMLSDWSWGDWQRGVVSVGDSNWFFAVDSACGRRVSFLRNDIYSKWTWYDMRKVLLPVWFVVLVFLSLLYCLFQFASGVLSFYGVKRTGRSSVNHA